MAAEPSLPRPASPLRVVPSLLRLAMGLPRLSRLGPPSLDSPAAPCLACPCRALPCLPCPSGSHAAIRRPTLPASRVRATPPIPSQSCRAVRTGPRRSGSRRASPAMPCRSLPFPVLTSLRRLASSRPDPSCPAKYLPCHASLARPGRTARYRFASSLSLPAYPCGALTIAAQSRLACYASPRRVSSRLAQPPLSEPSYDGLDGPCLVTLA